MMIRKSTEIYLDSNATTRVLPIAAQEAHDAMEQLFGNPSSSHTSGLRARYTLESAREMARKIIGAESGQIVFTSGATEAIQMAVFSTLCDVRERRAAGELTSENRTILYGATEHKAVPQAIQHWNRLLGTNNEVLAIPVDEWGNLDLEFIRRHAPSADMICTMAVNNETGVVTDLAAVEQAIRSENGSVQWLVDAVQAIGKVNLELAKTTINYATLSGHKIYAPKGIGVLYVREGSPLVPLFAGGGQEQGARGGTENLPGVAAIAAVMSQLARSDSKSFVDAAVLDGYRDQLVETLKNAFPTIVFNMPFSNSVATTINFSVKGFSSGELLDLFDAAGIRLSSGSACGSAVKGSYVLEAMGLPQWRCDNAIRMSFGPLATPREIELACERIEQVGHSLCDSCLVISSNDRGIVGQELDGLIQLKNGSMCTWLLMDSDSKRCVVIDPFEEMAERVETLIRCQESNVVAILDTHAHVDHDSCRSMLVTVIGQRAAESAQTNDALGWPETADGTVTLADGSSAPYIEISDQWILARTELPGHTVISWAYLVGPRSGDCQLTKDDVVFAFTGDTILMGGIGRTDFPASSVEQMFGSLHRLPQLISPDTIICPTHDYNNGFSTTLGFEQRDNGFLKSILDATDPMSLDEYLEKKPVVDSGISDETNSELVCGLIKSCEETDGPSIDIQRDELKHFFESHRDSLIIDVREPHEFSFSQNWCELGLAKPPENIPLTRLSGSLPGLLKSHHDSPCDVIFLCRSGRRSGRAAAVARRVGIETARHIVGGIALNVQHRSASEELAEPGYMI